MGSRQRELPLFPLNLVLFPEMILPLRIFEERYLLMMNACLEGDRTFGVVLIKSGKEVGEPAVPHSIGTTARITDVEKKNDANMDITAVGESRFHILEILRDHPYLVGRVEIIEEEDNPAVPSGVLERVVELSHRCLMSMLALNGEWVRQVDFPENPLAMSYLIAARSPTEPLAKQRLLEAPSAEARLKQELPILEAEAERLRLLLMQRMWLRVSHLN